MSSGKGEKEVELIDLESDDERGMEEGVARGVLTSFGRVTNYKRLVDDLYEMADMIMEGVKKRPGEEAKVKAEGMIGGAAGSLVKDKKEEKEESTEKMQVDRDQRMDCDGEIKEENKKLKRELKEAVRKCGENKELLGKVVEENRVLKERFVGKEGEVARLIKEVEEERGKVLGRDGELERMKVEVETERREKEELEGELSRLRVEVDKEWKKDVERKEELEREISRMKIEMEEERKKHGESREQLEAEINRFKEELEKEQTEKEKLEGEISRMKVEMDKERKTNGDSKEEFQAEIRRLKEEQKNKDWEELKREIAKLNEKAEHQRKQKEVLILERNWLRKADVASKNQLQRKINELKVQMECKEKLEKEIGRMKVEVDQERKKTEESKEELDREISRLKMELEMNQNKKEDVEEKLEGMTAAAKKLHVTFNIAIKAMEYSDNGSGGENGGMEQFIEEKLKGIKARVKLEVEKWKQTVEQQFKEELSKTKEIIKILQQKLRMTVLKQQQQQQRPQLALMAPPPHPTNNKEYLSASIQTEVLTFADVGVQVDVKSPIKSKDQQNEEQKEKKKAADDLSQTIIGQTANSDSEVTGAVKLNQPIKAKGAKIRIRPKFSPSGMLTRRRLPQRTTSKPIRYLVEDVTNETPFVPSKRRRVQMKQEQLAQVHGVDEEASKKGNFRCICGVQFKIKGSMLRHIREQLTGRVYKCKMCPQSFLTHNNLNMHIIAKHRTTYYKARYSCSFCAKAFASLEQMRNHKETRHKKKESQMNAKKVSKDADHTPLSSSTHFKTGPLNCSCGAKFTWRPSLLRHIQTQSQGKVFKCSWCPKSFNRADALKSHKDKCKEKPTGGHHHKQDCSSSEKWKCVCGVTFATRNSLRRHIQK